MKFLHIACLTGLLWLTGCATPVGTQDTTSNAPTTPTEAPAAPHTPLIPSGPLRPIASAQATGQQVMPLFTPSDLWDRIRRGFAMPDLQHELVQDREQWYATRPEYMQRMTERSRKYLFHIVEELERRGMPTELALLPYIESAFNPQAVSTAKAAGMWQFMPATGNYFDLKQNAFRDDRRDVLASTRAALDYLQKLYGMFGDWHLALAAYNWGEGSVGRAIARNQKAGLGTSYTDLTLPGETRMYVPKLQAVKNIVAHPDAYGTELPLIENHPYFQTVDISHDIDVALAARLAGVREEDFKALNPSLHRPVILAAGTPQILLPWDNAKAFERNFEAYNQGQYASWTVWTLPSTMATAEAARRVAMAESDLRTINGIPTAHADQGGFRAHRAALDHITRGRRRKRGRQRPDLAHARAGHAPHHGARTQERLGRQHCTALPPQCCQRGRLERCENQCCFQGRPTGGAVCACTHRFVGAGPPGQACRWQKQSRAPGWQTFQGEAALTGAQMRHWCIPSKPSIPMAMRYSATIVLSRRGNTNTRIPATREIRGAMLR